MCEFQLILIQQQHSSICEHFSLWVGSPGVSGVANTTLLCLAGSYLLWSDVLSAWPWCEQQESVQLWAAISLMHRAGDYIDRHICLCRHMHRYNICVAWFTRFVSKTLKTQGLDLDTDRLSDRHLIWTLIDFPYSTVQLFPSKLFWSFEYLYQLNFVLLSGPGACCLQSWLAAWLPAAAAWEPPGSLCSPAACAACQNPRGNHVPLANWHGNPSCLPPPPSPSDQRAAIRSVSPGLPLPKPAQALTSLQPVPETLDIQCQQPQLLLFQQCSAVVALVSSKQL